MQAADCVMYQTFLQGLQHFSCRSLEEESKEESKQETPWHYSDKFCKYLVIIFVV